MKRHLCCRPIAYKIKNKEGYLKATQKGYKLSVNHCAHVVQSALDAVGIEFRLPSLDLATYQMTRYMPYMPYVPSTAYMAIKMNNPKGKSICEKK